MKIRPLYDNVVVKRQEQESVSAGGIVLPGSAKEQPNQGTVIAVGGGKVLDNGTVQALQTKVGDTVIFGNYSGNSIKHLGEELVIMRESEIFGVIEK